MLGHCVDCGVVKHDLYDVDDTCACGGHFVFGVGLACQHGNLKRQCLTCELEEQIAELRATLRDWQKVTLELLGTVNELFTYVPAGATYKQRLTQYVAQIREIMAAQGITVDD